jgi:hypothetical protein
LAFAFLFNYLIKFVGETSGEQGEFVEALFELRVVLIYLHLLLGMEGYIIEKDLMIKKHMYYFWFKRI